MLRSAKQQLAGSLFCLLSGVFGVMKAIKLLKDIVHIWTLDLALQSLANRYPDGAFTVLMREALKETQKPEQPSYTEADMRAAFKSPLWPRKSFEEWLSSYTSKRPSTASPGENTGCPTCEDMRVVCQCVNEKEDVHCYTTLQSIETCGCDECQAYRNLPKDYVILGKGDHFKPKDT